MFLMIGFSFMVLSCQIKAQTISEHCLFQKCSRSKKSLKIEKMVLQLKKSLKISEHCLKLVKFMVSNKKTIKNQLCQIWEIFCWTDLIENSCLNCLKVEKIQEYEEEEKNNLRKIHKQVRRLEALQQSDAQSTG